MYGNPRVSGHGWVSTSIYETIYEVVVHEVKGTPKMHKTPETLQTHIILKRVLKSEISTLPQVRVTPDPS